jgi:hypothetical protein
VLDNYAWKQGVPWGLIGYSQFNKLHLIQISDIFKPKLSDFLLDLRRSLAHKGFAKIFDISTGMPAVFANPYASTSQHISSQKIAQFRLKCMEYLF